eukprot:752336-Hanusia_phi.AAC.2
MAKYGDAVIITAELIGGDGQGLMSKRGLHEDRLVINGARRGEKKQERRIHASQNWFFLPGGDRDSTSVACPSDVCETDHKVGSPYGDRLLNLHEELENTQQASLLPGLGLGGRQPPPIPGSQHVDHKGCAIESRLFHESSCGQPSPVFVCREIIDLQIDEEESLPEVGEDKLKVYPDLHNHTWDAVDLRCSMKSINLDESMSDGLAVPERDVKRGSMKDDSQPNEKLLSLLRLDRELELQLVSYGRTYQILSIALPDFVEDSPIFKGKPDLSFSTSFSHPLPHHRPHLQQDQTHHHEAHQQQEQSLRSPQHQLFSQFTLDRYTKLAVLLDDVKAKVRSRVFSLVL